MAEVQTENLVSENLTKDELLEAFKLMCTAKTLAEKYEANAKLTSKYVHATSRGHEAIQLATGLQLKPQDCTERIRCFKGVNKLRSVVLRATSWHAHQHI